MRWRWAPWRTLSVGGLLLLLLAGTSVYFGIVIFTGGWRVEASLLIGSLVIAAGAVVAAAAVWLCRKRRDPVWVSLGAKIACYFAAGIFGMLFFRILLRGVNDSGIIGLLLFGVVIVEMLWRTYFETWHRVSALGRWGPVSILLLILLSMLAHAVAYPQILNTVQ